MLTALTLTVGALAQTEWTPEQRRESILSTFHKRNAVKDLKQYPISDAKVAPKASNAGSLPDNRWFPGEWEEVKAVVVTCYYEYLVPGHENDMYWSADPTVSGYATYYRYTNGWQEQGGGPYIATIDTTSTFGNTFFYIMDAIQLGGAEAWVRVENFADSNIVLRKLNRMNLRSDNIRFIEGTGNSFWYRDCGPIAFYYGSQDSVAMMDFGYYPGRALDDSLPAHIERQMGIPNYITDIEWEGGNCLVDGAGSLFTSAAIYENNQDTYGQLTWNGSNPSTITYSRKTALSKAQVNDSLTYIMAPEGCHVLPAFKYDGGTGHIDLYADMWDENEFVFSKFPQAYSAWTDYKTAAKNIDSLCSWTSIFGLNYKCSYIPFPCTDNGGNFSSQSSYNSSYTRTYSNHTFVNNVIIQPCFSTVVNGVPTKEWDRLRIDSLRVAYPGYTIYPINVKEFDGSGGAIHCVTKQIPADNPVRILHPSITGNTNEQYRHAAAYIEADITNRSGIANARFFWRVDGGEWNEVAMTEDSTNHFFGAIPTQSLFPANGFATIEYYIAATSNNGKTITKPMTAAQGGYYTFYLGHNNDCLGINQAAEEHFGQFYPNPSSSKANIVVDLANGSHYGVSIIDAQGRTCHRSTLQANGTVVYTIDCARLAKGLYTVVFSGNGTKVARRLVVE